MPRTNAVSPWPEDEEVNVLEFADVLCSRHHPEADTYDPDVEFFDRVGPLPFALIIPTESRTPHHYRGLKLLTDR